LHNNTPINNARTQIIKSIVINIFIILASTYLLKISEPFSFSKHIFYIIILTSLTDIIATFLFFHPIGSIIRIINNIAISIYISYIAYSETAGWVIIALLILKFLLILIIIEELLDIGLYLFLMHLFEFLANNEDFIEEFLEEIKNSNEENVHTNDGEDKDK
jgi:hypothetical protein